MRRARGLTLVEILTLVVALVVIAAVAIPLWRVHVLHEKRSEAMKTLLEIQAAQDRHFGEHARYAGAGELVMDAESAN
jgi:type IV pilus assembly protein PilE